MCTVLLPFDTDELCEIQKLPIGQAGHTALPEEVHCIVGQIVATRIVPSLQFQPHEIVNCRPDNVGMES